jgi:molybdopterin molybdotransferase
VWDVAGVALPAAVAAAGGEVASVIHLADDRAASEAALAEAAADADAVITVGGISKGAHDHVRPALDALGAEVVVAGAAIRPGHPVRLARLGGTPVLALPGNPVSAVVCMTLFGRVLLGRDDVLTALPLAAAHRAGTPRTDLIRCALGPDGLVPAARQASHDVSGLAGATHLAVRPPGPERLEPGATLETLRMP